MDSGVSPRHAAQGPPQSAQRLGAPVGPCLRHPYPLLACGAFPICILWAAIHAHLCFHLDRLLGDIAVRLHACKAPKMSRGTMVSHSTLSLYT